LPDGRIGPFPALDKTHSGVLPCVVPLTWLSRRMGRFPRALFYLGVLASIVTLLYVLISFLDLPAWTAMAAAIAVVFHPVWLIWAGAELGRDGRRARPCRG
jgi:hypothetical protein